MLQSSKVFPYDGWGFVLHNPEVNEGAILFITAYESRPASFLHRLSILNQLGFPYGLGGCTEKVVPWLRREVAGSSPAGSPSASHGAVG